MLDEIQAFIDRLRDQKPPPVKDISATWPEMDKRLREDQAKAHQGMLDAADGIEEHLRRLYEQGADSPDAIDILDQVVAIYSATRSDRFIAGSGIGDPFRARAQAPMKIMPCVVRARRRR